MSNSNPNEAENFSAYLKAQSPPGGTVLGCRLLPLTIGHLEILDYVGSPIIGEDAVVCPADIFMAVAILSRLPGEAMRFVDDVGRATSKKRPPSRCIPIWRRAWAYSERGHRSACQQMERYLEANWCPPKLRYRKPEDRSDGIPYTEHLKGVLCEWNRATPGDVDNFPVAKAIHIVEGKSARETGKNNIDQGEDDKMARFFEEQRKRSAEGKLLTKPKPGVEG